MNRENDTGDRDTGDRDPGDGIVDTIDFPRNAWHPSHAPAVIAKVAPSTPTGRAALAALKEEIFHADASKSTQGTRRGHTGWHATPEPFRRLVARSAGLGDDTICKFDRDLTEAEKAAIRAAAGRLKERAEALFSI